MPRRPSEWATPRGPRQRLPASEKSARDFWRAYTAGEPLPASGPRPRLEPAARVSAQHRPVRSFDPDKPFEQLADVRMMRSAGYVYAVPMEYGDASGDLRILARAIVRAFRRRNIPMHISWMDPETDAFALRYFGDIKLIITSEETLRAIESFGKEAARKAGYDVEWFDPLIWRIRHE